jgi:hypothetical protein
MKKIISLASCLLVLNGSLLLAQSPPPLIAPPPNPVNGSQSFQQRLGKIMSAAGNPDEQLPTFNLDFPGGSPRDLVNAIEKATGKPLNVIIKTDDNHDVTLPALKLNGVNVAQIFQALESIPTVGRSDVGGIDPATGLPAPHYGFTTTGEPTENSIWIFQPIGSNNPSPFGTRFVNPRPAAPEKICRFYSLAPYLERGFTVDDITTAIQTGWKMEEHGLSDGKSNIPEVNYHKETKMLIAYGDDEKLRMIDSVLQTLPRTTASVSELDDIHKSVSNLMDESHKVIGNLQSQINYLNKELERLRLKPADEKSGK